MTSPARIAFYQVLLAIFFSSIVISSPIETTEPSPVSVSQTTPSLDSIKPLEERAGKHNWAFVCTGTTGQSSCNLYYACTGYPVGGYCDGYGYGYAHYQFYATYECEISCRCGEMGASNLDNCVWGMMALGCFCAKTLADMSQSELQEGVKNGNIRLPKGSTMEDLASSQSSMTPSVPTIFSTATIPSRTALGTRGNTDWAFICYKNGGQTPDKYATDLYQQQYRYRCEDTGRLQASQISHYCDHVCRCINLADGKTRWGVMCRTGILGTVCDDVANPISDVLPSGTVIGTEAPKSTSSLGPAAASMIWTSAQIWPTTVAINTSSASTTYSPDTLTADAIFTDALSKSSFTAVPKAALELRNTFAFICYDTNARPDQLLTNLCHNNFGFGCYPSGKASILVLLQPHLY